MPKHTYTIAINRVPAAREPMEYKFRQTACALLCAKDAAAVTFTMGAAKSHEDLISFRVDLVKDAMRKMYLLHAIRFGTRLKVRRVLVTVDGETVEYGKETPGFPFLHSMLTARDLALPESWQDPGFQNAVLRQTKSAAENDLRFACLFSFLAGTGKQFEIERFTCYWTAVNSLYNHLLQCAQPHFAADHRAARFEDLPHKKRKLLTGDSVGVGALMRLLGCGSGLGSQGDRTAYKSQYGAMKSYLRHIPREELPELQSQLLAHRRDRTWVPEGPLGEHLKICMDRTGQSAWGFLTLDYAYYMRCNYLHGSKTTILFSAANDPEIAAFRCLNVFLGEFLREMIPQLFREDWFTADTYRTAFPPER